MSYYIIHANNNFPKTMKYIVYGQALRLILMQSRHLTSHSSAIDIIISA